MDDILKNKLRSLVIMAEVASRMIYVFSTTPKQMFFLNKYDRCTLTHFCCNTYQEAGNQKLKDEEGDKKLSKATQAKLHCAQSNYIDHRAICKRPRNKFTDFILLRLLIHCVTLFATPIKSTDRCSNSFI